MTRARVTSILTAAAFAGVCGVASAQQPKPASAPAPAAAPVAPAPAAAPKPPAPAAAAPAPAPVAAPAAAKAPAPVTAPVTKPAAAAAPAPAPAHTAPAAPPAPAVAAAAGIPAPAAATPKPAPEMEQMKVLEGNWRCDGRAPAGPSGPEHAYKSTWRFKRDLDNFWWTADYQQMKGKAHPVPLKARGYLTYDPASKTFVMLGMDNMGGTTSESTTGWSGDVVTLAGDASMAGKKVQFREVITKKGDREFTWRGEMKLGADWVTLGEDRCKK